HPHLHSFPTRRSSDLYPNEADEWVRVNDSGAPQGYSYRRAESNTVFDLNQIVNYATPGYATAVMVSAQGIERVRTTAESHRRIRSEEHTSELQSRSDL